GTGEVVGGLGKVVEGLAIPLLVREVLRPLATAQVPPGGPAGQLDQGVLVALGDRPEAGRAAVEGGQAVAGGAEGQGIRATARAIGKSSRLTEIGEVPEANGLFGTGDREPAPLGVERGGGGRPERPGLRQTCQLPRRGSEALWRQLVDHQAAAWRRGEEES